MGSQAPLNPGALLLQRELVRLAGAADSSDQLWQEYKAECGVRVEREYDFGREWFALLDHAAEATIDKPDCPPLRKHILQSAEEVRRDLALARVAARQSQVDLATEIGLLRWHTLEWR